MATWEQILTSGTSIGKLSDVTITSADAGDVLICDGSGNWVDAVISGTSNEIVVASTAGAINISQPVDVTIGQDLLVSREATVTQDLTVNGGDFTLQNPNSDDRDTTLTIKSGANSKDAIISLWGNNGAAAGDQWEIKASAGNDLTFSNDVASDNTYVAMATFTPDATAADSKLVLAGDLHVGGDTLKLGDDTTFVYTSNKLTITEATVDVQGDITTSGSIKVGGNVIKASDGGSTITMDTSDNVTIAGDLTVTGNDLTFGNGATIVNTSNAVLTITEATTVIAGDAQVNGNIVGDADEAKAIFAATTTDTNFITIGGGGRVQTTGDFQVLGDDIYSSSSNCLSLSGSDVDVIGDLQVRGNGIHSSATDNVITFVGTNAADVNISGNLTVAGTTVTLDTETLLVEDNAIVLNSNATGDAEDGSDAGIIVKRGAANITNKNAALFWDESYANVDVGTTDIGGRWAVGLGTEGGTAPNTTFTAPAIGTYGGYVVGITESASAPHATDDLATGLGAMHIKTGTPGQIYIRVQ